MRKLLSVLSSTLQGGVRGGLLLLALVASMSAIYASDTQVDGIWYDFDSSTQTASVTYRGSNYDSYDDEYSYFVYIPETVIYNGTTYRVTSIGASAFSSCYLTSIIIPNSVTSIGEKAFFGCDFLTYVSIGSGIKTIGEMAFGDCYQLTYITCKAVTPPTLGSNDVFPPNLKTVYIPVDTYSEYWDAWGGVVFDLIDYGSRIIYIDVFANDEIMTNTDAFDCLIQNHTYEMGVGVITFSGTLTSIGNNAFKDCEYLRYIELPNTVTSIGNNAFERCGNLSDIELPNTVTSIGEYAFSDCFSLTSITIPNTVTSIESSTFSSCSSLTSITIPNNVTSIGNGAFLNCSSLTSITIPNSVTSIGEDAFSACDFTSITIPNSVTSIGNGAFSGCSSLTSITIPNSVTGIGYFAFSGCRSLTSMVVEGGNTTYDSRGNCNAIIETATNTLVFGFQKTVIPNTVTSIGSYAFSGCDSLTSITIPNSVTSIENSAFSSCRSLTSITIPNSVTSIGSGAFSSCSSFTSITIPNSVTSIGSSAFSGCSSLTSITIPNSVTSIGSSAFSSCRSLTSITIPNGVTIIGSWAFSKCSSLTSITIPNSVTSIEYSAFSDCSSLTSITIPNSVTSIGSRAFYSCKGLTSITIPNSVTSIGDNAFYISNLKVCCEGDAPATIGRNVFMSTAKIYVPNVEEYKTAWSTYASQITSAEFTYTLLGDAALGLSMDANNAAQQMQLQSDGTYTLRKTDISLSEGTYSYTARRTSEAPCFEPEDITSTLSITTAGKYDITFTLNPATDELTAQVTLKEPEQPEQLNQPDKLYFHPSTVWKEAGARFAAHFLSTTNESWVNMSDADGDGIYEVENPKTYNQIRFCRIDPNATSENISNNVWQATNTLQIPNNDNALNTCYAFYKNDWSLDGTWVVPTPLTANNCWTIINTYQGQTINIVVERQFFDIGEWYTLCLPFSCNASIFGEAHQFASLDVANDIVTIMTSLQNTIEAGAPYLFRPLSSYDHFIVENVKIPSFVTPQTISVSGGGFTISLTSVLQTEGTTEDTYWIGNGGYLYNEDVDKLGLRAYFNISKPAGMAPRFRVSTSEENATGFDILIDKENHTMKILENGQLVILRNGEKYNIQGQKL